MAALALVGLLLSAVQGTRQTTVDGLQLRNGTQLQAAVNASIAAGKALLRVAAGAYYFDGGGALLIYRARNWAMEPEPGARVELWFKMTSRQTTGGVWIRECEDVRIAGLTIDYDPPPLYQGTVQADAAPSSVALVSTDPGFPDPYMYREAHTPANDPSANYLGDAALSQGAVWPHATGFACNRTLGCPGHGAAVLKPSRGSLPSNIAPFEVQVQVPVRAGDKITLGVRKGITYHVQNSSRVTTTGVSIHAASLFGISEFDGGGEHVYRDIWLGRRHGVNATGGSSTALCGRKPGRLCLSVLASNADAFHSSGCRRGPTLRNVTLSFNGDDTLNIHSRLQLVSERVSDTELVVVDPRLRVAQGCPDDHPYGAAETMPNAAPGDTLDFFALSTFAPLGGARIRRLERLGSAADIAAAAQVVAGMDGRPPWNATPAIVAGNALDVGQICGPLARTFGLPQCASRVWRVAFDTRIPPAVDRLSIVALRGWDASGASVEDSQFFGGIDGIRWKSSGGYLTRNSFANSYLEVTPLQYFMEGPPALSNVAVTDNTYTACGGLFGTSTVDCSGGMPAWGGSGGFCRGVGGHGVEANKTCTGMVVRGNKAATSCCFSDEARKWTCCEICGRACACCASHATRPH